MEHFKKRLIHQHQKPPENGLALKAVPFDGDHDTSSNSSNNSSVNGVLHMDAKREDIFQKKIVRKRAVCRSKFRHDSLKIFKLGTSIPTSLCKSKEPYNVSAEKNLQLCRLDAEKNKLLRKEGKPISKESITEQIINSMEGNVKKDNFQTPPSVNLDSPATNRGKHVLPPIIPEIPPKRGRNSLSKSSDDENNKLSGSHTATSDDSEHTKSSTINYIRKTVIGSETPVNSPDPVYSNGPNQYESLNTPLKKPPPDINFPKKDTSCVIPNHHPQMKYLSDTPPVFASSKVPHNTPLSSSTIKISLPQNTSIFPVKNAPRIIVPNNPPTSLPKHNFCESRFENYFSGNNDADKPINLSIKTYDVSKAQPKEYKSNHMPLLNPESEPASKNQSNNLNPFPEIHHQISRLQNMPHDKLNGQQPVSTNPNRQTDFLQTKLVEESVARSTIQMAYLIMCTPFSVDNLVILNYSYKKIQSIVCSNNLAEDILRDLRKILEEILMYVNLKLFDSSSPISKSYTQKILEFDLRSHTAVLKDVIHLVREKCYDPEWMGHFLMILSRTKTGSELPTTWSASQQYLPRMPPYYPHEEVKNKQHVQLRKSQKLKLNQTKNKTQPVKLPLTLPGPLYSNDLKNTNYPTDGRYIPPKFLVNVPKVDKTSSNFMDIKIKGDIDETLKKEKIEKENVSHTVIIKDESMEVTKGDKDVETKINEEDKNKVVVAKILKYEITDIKTENSKKCKKKNVPSEDLNLFKELLRQEDKKIYNKILKKILLAKETVKDEVITIDDEEDASKSHLDKLKNSQSAKHFSANTNITSKFTEVVVIEDDNEDESIKENKSQLNKNYFSIKSILQKTPNATEPEEPLIKISVRKDISKIFKPHGEQDDHYKTEITKNPDINSKRKDLKLEIPQPYSYQISIAETPDHLNYQMIESPKVFTAPKVASRPYLRSYSSTSISPEMVHLSPPVTPYANLGLVPFKPEVNTNWTSWISEERKKGFLDAGQPAHRRQSVETISSVGSDYSPHLENDENVKIRIDAKWYRVKKTVMESIPLGKLCYVREKNYLIRYFDDNQLAQFVQNMNINLTSPVASEFLKQIRERVKVDGCVQDDIYISSYEVPEKNEIIQLSENINFTKDDFISIPELYVEEVEKVEKCVPKDFLSFYKYITGYQIVNNHNPISFQTFLTMHNTNGTKVFYKKYLLSILENRYV